MDHAQDDEDRAWANFAARYSWEHLPSDEVQNRLILEYGEDVEAYVREIH